MAIDNLLSYLVVMKKSTLFGEEGFHPNEDRAVGFVGNSTPHIIRGRRGVFNDYFLSPHISSTPHSSVKRAHLSIHLSQPTVAKD